MLPTKPDKDAYTQPRLAKEGCQHHLGCKCDVPYYLRPSTLAEKGRELTYSKSGTIPVIRGKRK